MRLHEIMGIQSNRAWGCCSLNDFRKFLGLKSEVFHCDLLSNWLFITYRSIAYSSFLEWNPDPKIAAAAEKLYGTIDRLELYVGLQAEAEKPKEPGAGLCPGKKPTNAKDLID